MEGIQTVTVMPLGGLGNQLFVYAAGLWIKEQTSARLVVDLRNFGGYTWHEYELGSFANSIDRTLNIRLPNHKAIASGYRRLSTLWEKAYTIGDDESWSVEAIRRLNQRQGLKFPRSVFRRSERLFLKGYFQNFAPIESVRDKLQKEIREIVHPSDWYLREFQELSNTQFISLHVRRGNYLSVPTATVVEENFYQRAVSLVHRLYGDYPIVVFTDEPKVTALSNLLPNSREVRMIGPFRDDGSIASPIEVLNLMSLSSISVLGNSTFGLWAAWLGKSRDKVVAPRPFAKKVIMDERFLLPADWLSIGY